MEEAVKTIGFDWTITWPPMLTYGAHTGSYQIVVNPPLLSGFKISQADLAH